MQQALTHVLLMDAVVSALQPSGATWGASHLSCCEKMQSESKKRVRAAPWRPERLHRGGPFCPPHLALTCALEPRAWSAPSSPRWASGLGAWRDALWAPRRSGRAVLAVTLRACRRVHVPRQGMGGSAGPVHGVCPPHCQAAGPGAVGAPASAFLPSFSVRSGPQAGAGPSACGRRRGPRAWRSQRLGGGPASSACRSVFGSRKQQTGEDVSHRGRYRRSAEAAARGSQAGGRAGSAGAWRRSLRQLHGHTPRA